MSGVRYVSPLFLFFVFLFIPLTVLESVAERRYLDITTTKTRKIKIAVPAFISGSGGGGEKYASILSKALEFHGIISIISPSDYGESQSADWQRAGADYTVIGRFNQQGGQLSFELRLLDVAGNSEVMGKSYNGTRDQANKMLFSYCDNVIETLTGMPGIANSRIAFVGVKRRAKEVYVTDILGEKIRQVTRHKNIVVSPRFIPQSNNLSYTSYHSGNQNLYITDLRQNKVTRVLSRRKGMNLAPAWSPDGSKMILTLSKDGNPDLYMLNSRGKILKRLTRNAGVNVSPTWSPDGKYIVFVSDRNPSHRPQLYLLELATMATKRISHEGKENVEPTWSPTENLIAYTSLRNGVYQICTMNPITGGSVQQLTTDYGYSESATWSPDGQQLLFSKRGARGNHIYAMMKDGSFQRKLFSFSGGQSYPQWTR